MSNREQDWDQIERYLRQQLQGAELQAFEKRLDEDDAFRQEVRLHRDLDTFGKQEAGLTQLHSDLNAIHAGKGSTTVASSSGWWKIAATLAMLVGVGIAVFWLMTPSASPEALFAEYFEPYPAYNLTRTTDSDLENTLSSSLNAYHTGDYANALAGLERYLADHPTDVSALFYSGICHLQLEDVAKAAGHFQQVIGQHDNLLAPQARWYLGLAHLKAGELDLARSQLTNLATRNDELGVKAELLLRKLEGLK